ncbi:ABC transporter ATP-binding protein [Hutsoniella sourekii]|uniref:ABC transporter ATP-binding protein n=1 Tax=Hutsoniella sourekii TaxID=87650 RepID=UPI000484293F|nr:ATP-binding cassette domain-containing protein [Hutsoniella sourekii]
MQEQVEMRQVSKAFQSKTGETIRGLSDVNLTLGQGEVVSVIGTNGAGKSTLFNCLSGQIPIDQGEIYLDGIRVDGLNQVQTAEFIGRVFQNPSMGTAPRMTVFENLMLAQKRGEARRFGRSLTNDNYQAMHDYLAGFRLDLEKRLDVPIEYLSGGQRQTVSLVMATLKRPKLLLLDEHTAALDPRTARQVMEMTQEMIQSQGLTTLMITHHLQDALTYSDRILLMHQGSIQKIYQKDQIQKLSAGELYEELESLVL